MKRPFLLALTALLVALVAAGCGGGGASATLGSNDVAVVGSEAVTKDQFQALLARAKHNLAAQKRPFPKPGTRDYETLKGSAIAFLLQRAELEQKAKDMGVNFDDKRLDARVEEVKKQFYGGDEKRYEDALKQQGLTVEQGRGELKADLISRGLYDKVTAKATVTDKEIQAYYLKNKAAYVQKESRDLRHILVSSKALADRLYTQLKGGADFAALAKKYSKDPGSKASGGKLTLTRGQSVPPFDRTLFALKKGELSHPVKTQYGYHLIQALSEIRRATTTPLDKVKASIRQQLDQQKKRDVMNKWVQDTQKEFCKGSKIKYQVGYTPTPDPCLTVTGATTTK